MPAADLVLLKRLGVALAIGLLIGLERGWERREQAEGSRIGGLRTFGLIGLLGAITAMLGGASPTLLLAAIGLALGATLAAGYWRESAGAADISMTTAIAGLVTYSLGALAGSGKATPAAAIAVVVALLLGFKTELHQLLRRIDRQELLATLRLLLISIVLLPILPNHGYGPWAALNPYRIWWMVVLVAAISYVGYFANRLFGERSGILLAGVFGGLASSTAVTVEFARRDQREPNASGLLSAGIIAASAIMFPRILLILLGVGSNLVQPLLLPLSAAGVVGLGLAGWLAWRGHKTHPVTAPPAQDNPLDLAMALKFGAMVAVIMLVVSAANAWLGTGGLYLSAGLAGLVDVDALTLTAATMAAAGTLALPAAALSVMIAAVVNTFVKVGIGWALAGTSMGMRIALGAATMIIAAAVLLWAVP